MKNVLFKVGILAFVLLFGTMIISCDDGGGGGGGGDSDWINVTSLAQINGTWKGIISYTYTHEGINYKQEQEMTYIINASARTITVNTKMTVSQSGFSNDQWTLYTSSLTPGTQTITEDGITYTVTIDTTKRTITTTATIPPQTITDADIAEISSSGMQISKDGKKLKQHVDGFIDDEGDVIIEGRDIIYIKQ